MLILCWLLVPLALACVRLRYLVCHRLTFSMLHTVIFAGSLGFSWWTYYIAQEAFSVIQKRPNKYLQWILFILTLAICGTVTLLGRCRRVVWTG